MLVNERFERLKGVCLHLLGAHLFAFDVLKKISWGRRKSERSSSHRDKRIGGGVFRFVSKECSVFEFASFVEMRLYDDY